MREVEIDNPNGALKEVIDEMNRESLSCVYGTWLVEGSPSVILLDIASCRHKSQEIITSLFRAVSLPIDHSDGELMDALIFGFMVFNFLSKVLRNSMIVVCIEIT